MGYSISLGMNPFFPGDLLKMESLQENNMIMSKMTPPLAVGQVGSN